MGLLLWIIEAVRVIILVDVVLSWVMRDPEQFPRNFTQRITAPMYAPIRAVLDPRKTGGFDLAPLIVLILLSLLRDALT